MENNITEEYLLKEGWEKECLSIHIAQFDKTLEHGARRLSYDLGTNFSIDQITPLKMFVQEVNNRFPNIKVSLSGTGYIQNTPSDDQDIENQEDVHE